MLDDRTAAFPLIVRPGDFTPGLTYPNVYALQSSGNICAIVTLDGKCVGLNLPRPTDIIYSLLADQGDLLTPKVLQIGTIFTYPVSVQYVPSTTPQVCI
jgi:hypothetical protein